MIRAIRAIRGFPAGTRGALAASLLDSEARLLQQGVALVFGTGDYVPYVKPVAQLREARTFLVAETGLKDLLKLLCAKHACQLTINYLAQIFRQPFATQHAGHCKALQAFRPATQAVQLVRRAPRTRLDKPKVSGVRRQERGNLFGTQDARLANVRLRSQ